LRDFARAGLRGFAAARFGDTVRAAVFRRADFGRAAAFAFSAGFGRAADLFAGFGAGLRSGLTLFLPRLDDFRAIDVPRSAILLLRFPAAASWATAISLPRPWGPRGRVYRATQSL
jgi:hypothetical protein